ncbi:aminomethyl-transferring glycine dehydrogenase subunit GcvPB [Clostridium sp. Cult2]|uniref:aminomethyl-transferring glycine dehydrogenase subunit GcvPB n=1 Tax=Clostridium sp. Cult2 TaxID=2079003 RepID=UPI001F025A4C|nr:aminomethyl-transferring glycine dehydrogenase subunit GcvPB [Clostridium sp. Cult2]MCF6465834.1 glycine dehydrogenase subunit 2 [Clostridium sp. Cult2]
MSSNYDNKLRNYHQAKWDEPIIFELSTEGQRGILIPKAEKVIEDEVGDGISSIPANMIRKESPKLPEIPQPQVLRHYLHVSQQTLGGDLNIDVGQGTCTIKYNPKINDQLASLDSITELHPLQDEDTVQGALEIIYKTDLLMREISGLDKFSFQPGGGSQALFTISSIIHAYFEEKNESQQRDEIITTIFSHPSDAATPAIKGYKVINLYPDDEGYPSVDALKSVLSERTAALMITNPEDTGLFNPNIKEFTRLVHEVGGLCSYDQANANGILGITRAKEAGFDMCFFNLHKTFSAPHGCGGPATGALGVTKELSKYLPVPTIEYDGIKYYLDYDKPQSIGKVRAFYGAIPVVLKAYAWIMNLGEEGLKEAARIAVLNNNYLLNKIIKIKGASAPYSPGKHRIEQTRYSWDKLTNDTGVTTLDIARRMADFGVHYWTSHDPWIVPEPFTLEPTESYTKDELDEYIAILEEVSKEAYENPEYVRNAPHNSVIHKVDTSYFEDPSKWAVTWKAYKKKNGLK